MIRLLQKLFWAICGETNPRVHLFGARRSSQWPRVRAQHLAAFPRCAACGNHKSVEVHHVIPVHVDPSKELDPENLRTLCENGPGGMNCHLVVGHAGNWKLWNRTVDLDSAYIGEMLAAARFAEEMEAA